MKDAILRALRQKSTWAALAALAAALGLIISPELRAAISQILTAFGITQE